MKRAPELENGFNMVISFFRNLWVKLLIALDPMVTPEGFELTGKPFVLQPYSSDLNPAVKRKITICNLYVNQRQSIAAVALVLDTSRGRVVSTLIEEGIIKERRHSQSRHVRHERRRHSLSLAGSSLDSGLVGSVPTNSKPITRSPSPFQTLFKT